VYTQHRQGSGLQLVREKVYVQEKGKMKGKRENNTEGGKEKTRGLGIEEEQCDQITFERRHRHKRMHELITRRQIRKGKVIG